MAAASTRMVAIQTGKPVTTTATETGRHVPRPDRLLTTLLHPAMRRNAKRRDQGRSRTAPRRVLLELHLFVGVILATAHTSIVITTALAANLIVDVDSVRPNS